MEWQKMEKNHASKIISGTGGSMEGTNGNVEKW